MNYTQVVSAALRYADKANDQHVTDMMDLFMPMVESRVNQVLQVSRMTTRATVPLIAGQEYYGLPADFSGVRDIEIKADLDASIRRTLSYLSPEQMNQRNTIGYYQGGSDTGAGYYTLIAQQIQIFPKEGDSLMEIVYYQKVPPLIAKDEQDTNWLSDMAPECYIFGLLVEISSFLKDDAAASMWQARFKASVEGISEEDKNTRWSGTALQIRIG